MSPVLPMCTVINIPHLRLELFNMKIKCIAIGNRIMGDDSIGIKVLEELSTELEKEEIELPIIEKLMDRYEECFENGDIKNRLLHLIKRNLRHQRKSLAGQQLFVYVNNSEQLKDFLEGESKEFKQLDYTLNTLLRILRNIEIIYAQKQLLNL